MSRDVHRNLHRFMCAPALQVSTFSESPTATRINRLEFALSFLVVAVVAPIVEELTFRGLGFGLLSKYGVRVALVGTAVLFGLVHGFLVALPLFVIVGLALGWLRMRSGSVYPGMVMHGLCNAAVTVAAISLG